MNALVGDDLNVNIEQEDGRLFFRLWKNHQWGSCTLYYFPVKFLESLNPALRRIAVTFIHKLMKANGIDTFLDYEDTDFMFEMLSECDDSDSSEGKERLKLLDSYQNGKINRLLKRVESKSYYKDLPKGHIEMKRVHYTDSYLMNPQHPVTVNIIGAGGTGSQVLTCMARLDVTLRTLGHPGLFVTLYDPDTVTEANIGRQLFSPSELGLNKAQCLVTRINHFFGNDWKAEAILYPSALKGIKRDEIANITITCTDNIKSMLDLWKVPGSVPKKIRQPASGQYETVGSLKVITRFVKYARVKEEDSGPSCSLAEALEKQDLFINSTLAQFGCNILWKMFRNGMLEHHGLFLNLETMKVNPIVI